MASEAHVGVCCKNDSRHGADVKVTANKEDVRSVVSMMFWYCLHTDFASPLDPMRSRCKCSCHSAAQCK